MPLNPVSLTFMRCHPGRADPGRSRDQRARYDSRWRKSSPAFLAITALLGGCNSGTQDNPAVTSDRVVMRPYEPQPAGTAPRGSGVEAAALATPGPPVTPALVARGEARFLAFCSPCHGARGSGDGAVVAHGFPKPPSYHDERLRQAPPAHLVSVITDGLGKMYPYAERVPPEDRWAIAHYIKTLQRDGASGKGGAAR